MPSATLTPAPTRELTVCLVGMPNAGKTTLMNAITGGNFKTANYAGVTVSLLRGRSRPEFGPVLQVTDLPGVHSNVNPSPEEAIACEVIEGRNPKVVADAFILVVDATQLERHLKFSGLVARQSKPLVIALTMTDLLPRAGLQVDVSKLQAALGLPVVAVDARTGEGVERLLDRVRTAGSQKSPLAELPSDPILAFGGVRRLLQSSGAVQRVAGSGPDPVTARIDRIVLDRWLAFPIFFAVLVGLFASIFWLAQPFMDFVDGSFVQLADLLKGISPDSLVVRFLADGIVAGLGAVAVFFPQILILFLLMSLLEDSGYLARGAAIVDRPLAALGLHGRSFVPMLSGFACAIPAVFAARSIPAKRERLLTIWILPLMSCSARLPVYGLLLTALIPGDAWKKGLAMGAIYVGSLLVGSITAGLASRILSKHRNPSILAMELPAYRKPRWKPIVRATWARGSSYLQRAAVPIIAVSAVLWVLSSFGPSGTLGIVETPMDQSFAARIGHTLEPALEPMGADWRVGVGLISAFAAREIFVSSMAIVFHVEGDDEETQQAGLLAAMRDATFADTGLPIFTTASIVGLVVFFFFSLQCFSTVAVVRKELGSTKLAALQLAFYTGLGYVLSVATVQGLRAIGIS